MENIFLDIFNFIISIVVKKVLNETQYVYIFYLMYTYLYTFNI